MNSFEIFSKVLPVFLLFILGYIFKRTGFLMPQTASQMKKLVANITLPALIFRAFIGLVPGKEEVSLALMMFVVCVVLLFANRLFMVAIGKKDDIRAYMLSGFEAGMLGYALFLSVFGDSALSVFATVDLGQVLFVFIVLLPMLLSRNIREAHGGAIRNALRNAIANPVVWAILGGLFSGTIGRSLQLSPEPFAPISGFLEIVGNLTVPLIAIAIGYELSFSRKIMGKALLFVLFRKVILVAVALVLARFLPVDNELITLAFFTMLLLPPPFVVTLASKDDELSLVSGILSLSTVVSIFAFAAAMLVMGS